MRAAERIVAAALMLMGASAAHAQRDAAPAADSGLFEIRIGRLPPFVVGVEMDSAGTLRIPLDAILRAAGVVRPHDQERAGVTSARLAQLLDARVDVDRTTLAITIQRATPFPAERDAERLAANARAAARAAAGVSPATRWVPRTGGALIDWRVVAAPSEAGTSLFAQSRLGLALAGGDLTLDGYTQNDAFGGRRTWGDWSYGYVDPTREWFRELRVGDLLGGDVFGRSLRGVSVTNRQPFRHGFFADIDIVPSVPGGWSYDLYRDGQLVDYADEGGIRRPARLSLQYGATPLEVHAYGPTGQVRVEPLMLLVPSSQLPRGRVEYDVVAGRCATRECRRLAFGTADVGLTDSWTAGLGLQLLSDSLHAQWSPVTRVSYAPFNGWQLQADYQPAVLERLRLSYSGVAPISGSIEGGLSYEVTDALRTLTVTNDRWFAGASVSAHVSDASSGWLPSAALINGWVNGDSATTPSWNAGVEAILRGSSIGVFHSSEPSYPRRTTTLRATLVRPWARRRALREISVISAGLGVESGGARFLDLGATLELGRSGTLSMAARIVPATYGGSAVSLSYAISLDAARVGVQVRSDRRSRAAAVVDVSSALAIDSRFRPLVDATVSARSAGVSGIVFYDENANGVFDAGDRVADGVRVFVGGHEATTDHGGGFRLWNVVPYEPIDVRVDSIVGIDPAYSQFRDEPPARATPNVFNPVEVRLVGVHELTGRAELDGSGAPGGVRLLLEHVTRQLRYETITFADGSYTFDRVFPGLYRLSVAGSAEAALGAHASAVTVRVPGSPGPALRLLTKR